MRLVDGVAVFSPSDLTGYLACDHLLTLELRAMVGELVRPERDDPELAVLARRGLAHEERYLEQLRAEGRSVAVIGAEQVSRALATVGRFASGRRDVSSEHDRELADAFEA